MQLVMVYTPWITVICVVAFIGIATADWDRWWSDARYQTTDNAYIKSGLNDIEITNDWVYFSD